VDVVVIRTEGRAGEAEVEIDGHRLTVVDAFSRVGEPEQPGPMANPKLEVVTIAPLSETHPGPARAKRLERQWGWRYLGHGEIISTRPIRADLGALTLELPDDEQVRVGDGAVIAIDRIILSRAS
jgi:hypothetical protein